jgi:hypothetical protein
MLTGYNTDVSYGGEIFHVQTEDKGLNSPIILSLVYRAGTILAAKRTAYTNLIQDGVVDEVAVAQMLNRQHQILVAAIQAGKSGKLVELSRQQGDRKVTATPKPHAAAPVQSPVPPVVSPAIQITEVPERPAKNNKPAPAVKVEIVTPPVRPVPDSRTVEALTFDQIIAGYLQNTPASEQLRIEILYPSKFRAGDEVTVRAAILSGGINPTYGANVKLQILGTKIEAQTWTGRTDLQGLVSFHVKVPIFTSGAAALILKAQAPNGQEAEAKFMITHK